MPIMTTTVATFHFTFPSTMSCDMTHRTTQGLPADPPFVDSDEETGMAWATPQNAKNQVDMAGKIIVRGDTDVGWYFDNMDEYFRALSVVNNWRSSHNFPLNTIQNGLRRRAQKIDSNALIAQRIKRLPAITAKLARFPTMQLGQMQDIGGCRAVVENVEMVNALLANSRQSRSKHEIVRVTDYMAKPRYSGYRGVHVIYRYKSDLSPAYNGLAIETQLRSSMQHSWATAVETVGTFIKRALKSSQGEEEWLRFFALMGTEMAFREGTSPVPGTPIDRTELVAELKSHVHQLDVVRQLATFGATLQEVAQPGSSNPHFYLLELDPSADTTKITGFSKDQQEKATDQYLAVEKTLKDRPGTEAVLVSVDSIDLLRKAYPNYFLDTKVFVKIVEYTIRK